MKKNILILTDFSENASSAAEAGLALCSKLNTDLLLFHTYIDYPALPFASDEAWNPESFPLKKQEAEKKLRCLTEGLEYLAAQFDAASHQPTIQFRTDDGALGVSLETILEQQSIELIVIGARSPRHDDPLAGADTNAIIRYANRPVLVIPAGTNLAEIHQIVFATDFDPADLEAVRYLVKLSKLFGFGVEVIHVGLTQSKTADQDQIAFKKSLDELHATGLRFVQVNGKDLVTRLNKFATENGPVILALRHHHHPFFINLFVRSKAKALLEKQKTPLLIFPESLDT